MSTSREKKNEKLTHRHGRKGKIGRRLRETSLGISDYITTYRTRLSVGFSGGCEVVRPTSGTSEICRLESFRALNNLVLDLLSGTVSHAVQYSTQGDAWRTSSPWRKRDEYFYLSEEGELRTSASDRKPPFPAMAE